VDVCGRVGRYNCNRYDEDEAKKARDSQEVCITTRVLPKNCNLSRLNE